MRKAFLIVLCAVVAGVCGWTIGSIVESFDLGWVGFLVVLPPCILIGRTVGRFFGRFAK